MSKRSGQSRTSRPALVTTLLALLLFPAACAADPPAWAQPHRQRRAPNLVKHPGVEGANRWSIGGDASFDASQTRTPDGSGSIRLKTPWKSGRLRYSYVSAKPSNLIRVRPGTTYTYSCYMKSRGWPAHVVLGIAAYDASRRPLGNQPSSPFGNTADDRWEEAVISYTAAPEHAYVQLKVTKTDNAHESGLVWVDDFYFGEQPATFGDPPTPKAPFMGSHVRVDALGNIEVFERAAGSWKPFFPLCMYVDHGRPDHGIYSRQGWNCNMWAGSAPQVKKSKDAVSAFNPDGMMSGFGFTGYLVPGHRLYGDMRTLEKGIRAVFEAGLGDHLLLYYWDNENSLADWRGFQPVVDAIKKVDTDANGVRRNPIYVLQGNYGTARVYAAAGLSEIVGTYAYGGATGGPSQGLGSRQLTVIDNVAGQTNPTVFAQLNGVVGAGEMRRRIYNALIEGARGIGHWRDCFDRQCRAWSIGNPWVKAVEEQEWWPDFPALRREIDRMLPLIREPHWTTWSATGSSGDSVILGTRDHQGEGYVFASNQGATPVGLSIAIEGLPYAPAEVRDFFSDEVVAQISGGSFGVVLPGLGIAQGTAVYRLVRP